MNRKLIISGIGIGAIFLAMSSAGAATDMSTIPAAPGSDASAPSMTPPVTGERAMPMEKHTPSTSDRAMPMNTQGSMGGTNGLPAPQQQNGVSYITGGFGEEQSAAFKAAIPDYSVAMVFSEASGAYLADIAVQIKAAGGAAVDIPSAGPYLLLNLPDGKYTAVASNGGKSLTRHFTVAGKKGQRIGFAW